MNRMLHLISQPPELWATAIIQAQTSAPDLDVQVIDLMPSDLDYEIVLEEIFRADCVAVW
jgi:hypothetical protein